MNDLLVGRLRKSDEVNLVDGENDMTNPEQGTDQRVAPGLNQHAFTGIDQDDGEISPGRAGRHVSRILFMSRRVGNDEGSALRGEEAIGDVDRDALFPLGFEPVDQQREIDLVAGGAVLPRVPGERAKLIVEHEPGIVE